MLLSEKKAEQGLKVNPSFLGGKQCSRVVFYFTAAGKRPIHK
jgi:hypothetical protein